MYIMWHAYCLLFSVTFTIYYIYVYFLPSLARFTTRNATLTLRQAIYYSLLSSSGGTQSGSHFMLCFDSTAQ